MKRRRFPLRLRATAEKGEGGDPWSGSAGAVVCTTHQEEDFALGTAEGETWAQAETFFLQYCRRTPARGLGDVRTVYARYLINDQQPGRVDSAPDGPFRGEEDSLRHHGRVHTVQEGRVALVLVRPLLNLAGQMVTALRYAVILPTHFGSLEKITTSEGHVFIQDGPIYLALRSLNATDWGRKESVRVESVNHYRVISFFNYEGSPRTFSPEELGQTLNGMVAVVGCAREESFAEFCRRVVAAELLDYYHGGMRTTRYRIGELDFGFSYGVKLDRVRFVTINGKPMTQPIWEAEGLPVERLPFLGEPPKLNSLKLPYKHLRVIWAPDAPWLIASQGRKQP